MDFPKYTWLLPSWASLGTQLVKNLSAMQETWVRSLGWGDPLEKRKATPVFCPGEFQGLYSPWGRKESDTSELLSLSNPWWNSSSLFLPLPVHPESLQMPMASLIKMASSLRGFHYANIHNILMAHCTGPRHLNCIPMNYRIMLSESHSYAKQRKAEIFRNSWQVYSHPSRHYLPNRVCLYCLGYHVVWFYNRGAN